MILAKTAPNNAVLFCRVAWEVGSVSLIRRDLLGERIGEKGHGTVVKKYTRALGLFIVKEEMGLCF